MARAAREFERNVSRDQSSELDEEENELEYEEDLPRGQKRGRVDLRRYGVPLAGLVLVATVGLLIWLVAHPGRGNPPAPAGLEIQAQGWPTEKTRGAPGAGAAPQTSRPLSPDSNLRSTGIAQGRAEESAATHFQDLQPSSNQPAETGIAGERVGGADEFSALQQRFDRLDTSLQTLQGVVQLILTEMRSSRASGQAQEALDAADRMLGVLKKQLSGRDQEIARLRRELSAREHLTGDTRVQAQQASARSALTGWEIVGLTARNAALKDPSGQTHVVSIGESITDGVQLRQIDPAGTRIMTNAGDITYRGTTPAHGTR